MSQNRGWATCLRSCINILPSASEHASLEYRVGKEAYVGVPRGSEFLARSEHLYTLSITLAV